MNIILTFLLIAYNQSTKSYTYYAAQISEECYYIIFTQIDTPTSELLAYIFQLPNRYSPLWLKNSENKHVTDEASFRKLMKEILSETNKEMKVCSGTIEVVSDPIQFVEKNYQMIQKRFEEQNGNNSCRKRNFGSLRFGSMKFGLKAFTRPKSLHEWLNVNSLTDADNGEMEEKQKEDKLSLKDSNKSIETKLVMKKEPLLTVEEQKENQRIPEDCKESLKLEPKVNEETISAVEEKKENKTFQRDCRRSLKFEPVVVNKKKFSTKDGKKENKDLQKDHKEPITNKENIVTGEEQKESNCLKESCNTSSKTQLLIDAENFKIVSQKEKETKIRIVKLESPPTVLKVLVLLILLFISLGVMISFLILLKMEKSFVCLIF